jgi:hypothetical protein|tara:strand:+ start:542 stop:862 length:321 start_codon:yes stop_codon:yes gene_type:complete
VRIFTSDKDVWDVIDLLIDETEQANYEGKSFNIAESVMAQLPFFACNNLILNKDAQKDISRYIYSKDFGISPYKGSYGEQPQRWIEKSFTIKNLIERQKSKAMKNG